MWDFVIGQTVQAEDADGKALYRLRVDGNGDAVGGSGGAPGGAVLVGDYSGYFGYQGAGETISGLSIQ